MRRDPTEFRERFARWKNGELVYKAGIPHYEDGKDTNTNLYDSGAQRYIDATQDEQNGRYIEQSFLYNPLILFIDPSGISGYHQVKLAFTNGNSYDKAVSILGAVPYIGKLKGISNIGNVINVPSDMKSYSDWMGYYDDIIYTDTKHGRIGTRGFIGSYDYHNFERDVESGNIRRATPDEIKFWYTYLNGQKGGASPIPPLGSVINNIIKMPKK